MVWPWQQKTEEPITWERTEIERTLDHEPNQKQTDFGTAWDMYEDLAKRNPEAAAKMLKTWKQWEQEATQ